MKTSVPQVLTKEQFMKLATEEIMTDGQLDLKKAHNRWKEMYEDMKIAANDDPKGWQAQNLTFVRRIVEQMEKINNRQRR